MALPKRTTDRLANDSAIIIKWIVSVLPDLTLAFIIALMDVVKTGKTEPMDNFFRPLVACSVVIPESVQMAISTMTQVITEYEPRQRSLKL